MSFSIFSLSSSSGAFLVLSPSFFGDAPPVETRWYANLLYFASNIPMALSAVYKEVRRYTHSCIRF